MEQQHSFYKYGFQLRDFKTNSIEPEPSTHFVVSNHQVMNSRKKNITQVDETCFVWYGMNHQTRQMKREK